MKKEIILYLLFGGLTTLVNVIVYSVSFYIFNIGNVPATIVAWIISVAFAYITNRKYVFESKNVGLWAVTKEAASFVFYRILSGLLDVAIMYVSVDVLGWNNIVWKIISNIIVVIFNYVASKLRIFKNKN